MHPVKLNTFSNLDANSLSTVNKPIHALYDTLVAEISRYASTMHAQLFAEPVASDDGGTVDWYGPAGSEAARPFTQLSKAEQTRAREHLRKVVGDLEVAAQREGGALAGMLLSVLQVPTADDVLFFGDQPLLVRWGMSASTRDTAQNPVRDILSVPAHTAATDRARGAAQPATPTGAPLAHAVQVPTRHGRSGSGSAVVLSGALTLVLLLTSGLMLLQNCGLALPTFLTGGSRVALFNFCATAAPTEGLTVEYVRRMEKDIGLEIAACEPRQEDKDTEVSEQDIEKREKTQGIVTGAMGITLAWNGKSDLDLHVICPNGDKISHGGKSACEGKLQLDMNAGSNRSVTPIENIFWEEDNIPSGDYHVHVACFGTRPLCDEGVPYTVEVHNRGGSSIARFNGTAKKKISSKPQLADPTFAGTISAP